MRKDEASSQSFRTRDCRWNQLGIIYSEYTDVDRGQHSILETITSRLVIGNFSEHYIGSYHCEAECNSNHRIRSELSTINLIQDVVHGEDSTETVSNDQQPKTRYNTSTCRSCVNNFLATEVNTNGDKASRKSDVINVTVSWDVLINGSECPPSSDIWNLTLLEWDSVKDLPGHDYNVAAYKNAVVHAISIPYNTCNCVHDYNISGYKNGVVSAVSIPCNTFNCVVPQIQLKKDKYYQFRLIITAENVSDTYGSAIYHFSKEEKPVILSFSYCEKDSKLRCYAKGVPTPTIRISKGNRQPATGFITMAPSCECRSPPCNCEVPSCLSGQEYVSTEVNISTSGEYICEASNVRTSPLRKMAVEANLNVSLP